MKFNELPVKFRRQASHICCDNARRCRGFCRDATLRINKSNRLCSGKPRDVVKLIGSMINGCSFTAGTTWSLLITFIKASLPPQRVNEVKDQPSSFTCVSLVSRLLKKKHNNNKKCNCLEQEGKDEKWLFTATCLPWLPRQQQSEQSIRGILERSGADGE